MKKYYFISGERIEQKEKIDGLYYYGIRDNGGNGAEDSIEKRVIFNHYADMITNFEIANVKSFGYELLKHFAKNYKEAIECNTYEELLEKTKEEI